MTRLALAAALVFLAACETYPNTNATIPEQPPPGEKVEKQPPEKTQRWATPGKPAPPAPAPAPAPGPLSAFLTRGSKEDEVDETPYLDGLSADLAKTGAFTMVGPESLKDDDIEDMELGEGRYVGEEARARIREATSAAYLIVCTGTPPSDSEAAEKDDTREILLVLSALDSGIVAATARASGKDAVEAEHRAADALAEDVKTRVREGTLAGPGSR